MRRARTPRLMGQNRAAEYLGVDRVTLYRWRKHGEGPPRSRIGKRYYYVLETLQEWLKDGAPADAIRQPSAQQRANTRASNNTRVYSDVITRRLNGGH